MSESYGGRIRVFFDVKTLKNELNQWRTKKIKSLSNSDWTYNRLAWAYAKKLDPYVPFFTGNYPANREHSKHLAKVTIDRRNSRKGGITYSAVEIRQLKDGSIRKYNYAKVQYAPEKTKHQVKNSNLWDRDRLEHPRARSHWNDETVRLAIWPSFVKEARKIVNQAIKRRENIY